MANLATIVWTWTDDGAMCPLSRFRSMCDRELVIGEHYRLQVIEERSEAAHGFFFARLHDLWLSLPDHLATEFPTETSLRKRALIMTGFRREKRWVASSKEEARKLAAWLRPEADEDDEYALISINENIVIRWTALSQSRKGMPVKGQFYESKTKVLDWIEDLIGVKDSGEAREREGHALNDSAAPAMPPLEPEYSPTSLGARLRALAESLRKDTPAEFDAAWAALKITEEALALYRACPKELEAVKKLSAQTASGLFNDVEYEEVLGKIVQAAGK